MNADATVCNQAESEPRIWCIGAKVQRNENNGLDNVIFGCFTFETTRPQKPEGTRQVNKVCEHTALYCASENAATLNPILL